MFVGQTCPAVNFQDEEAVAVVFAHTDHFHKHLLLGQKKDLPNPSLTQMKKALPIPYESEALSLDMAGSFAQDFTPSLQLTSRATE